MILQADRSVLQLIWICNCRAVKNMSRIVDSLLNCCSVNPLALLQDAISNLLVVNKIYYSAILGSGFIIFLYFVVLIFIYLIICYARSSTSSSTRNNETECLYVTCRRIENMILYFVANNDI